MGGLSLTTRTARRRWSARIEDPEAVAFDKHRAGLRMSSSKILNSYLHTRGRWRVERRRSMRMNDGLSPKSPWPNAVGTVRVMRNRQGTGRANSAAIPLRTVKIPLPAGSAKSDPSH